MVHCYRALNSPFLLYKETENKYMIPFKKKNTDDLEIKKKRP
jgi:hypothetical protein